MIRNSYILKSSADTTGARKTSKVKAGDLFAEPGFSFYSGSAA